jgi:protein-S-isoprenylcysteine O-methyltransferase Ste14
VREQHALIKSGVYRLVRHPMYSSFFLLGAAQMLLLPNWLAGTSGLIGAGMLFAFRVLREERMMLESFGDEYRSYMANTKRIIPWIL